MRACHDSITCRGATLHSYRTTYESTKRTCEMPFALAGDIALHYQFDGIKTGVPLVFINSLGTDLRLWDQVTPHFADQFPILRYDKRGHGLSDCPPGPYTIRDLSDDLASLLNHLGMHEVILIGISVGGMIALDYTIQF